MGLENLKIIMKMSGVGVDELSELSGVPKSTINKIICGATPDPRYSTVKQLVNALNLGVDELVDYLDLTANDIEQNVSTTEWNIIKKYRDLDGHGREMVDLVLEKEYERSASSSEPDSHARYREMADSIISSTRKVD